MPPCARFSNKCMVEEEKAEGLLQAWGDSNGDPRQVVRGDFAIKKATRVKTSTGCIYAGGGRDGNGKALKVLQP